MNNKQKGWLLVGPVIFSFAMAMTTPVIRVYFIIELCAETEFCCKHCVFSNKGKQCGSTTDSYVHDNYTNDSYTDDNACVDGIRAWLEQEQIK